MAVLSLLQHLQRGCSVLQPSVLRFSCVAVINNDGVINSKNWQQHMKDIERVFTSLVY